MKKKFNTKYFIIAIIILIIIFAIIGILYHAYLNKESRNVIATEDIPAVETQAESSDLAYISGTSETIVTKRQPNIYLQNDEANAELGFVFKYTVYVNNKEVFQSGEILPGEAEPYSIYGKSFMHNGENDLSYKVNVYRNDKLVASTNLNNLRLIQQ